MMEFMVRVYLILLYCFVDCGCIFNLQKDPCLFKSQKRVESKATLIQNREKNRTNNNCGKYGRYKPSTVVFTLKCRSQYLIKLKDLLYRLVRQ